jgi:hypothetical protein
LGGRFPALAVFGLPALTVALALVVLWGLRPWEDSADPHEAPLGIETAVTGGKALPAPSTAGVAAGVAVPAGPGVQVAQRASGDAGPNPSPAPNSDGSPATVVVAPARAIAVAKVPSSPAGPAPESGAGEEVPVGATTGEAPPEGTSSPVTTPAGTGGGPASKGPVTAGAKSPVLEGCEGDEYVITVTFLDEESTAPTVEEAPVEIVLERLNEDGTTDELQLEGDLSDAHALAATLEAEGNCVKVEIAQPEAEGAEAEAGEPGASEELPGSGEEVVEPAEVPVPVSP